MVYLFDETRQYLENKWKLMSLLKRQSRLQVDGQDSESKNPPPMPTIAQRRQKSVTVNELVDILVEPSGGHFAIPKDAYNEVFQNIYIGDAATALSTATLREMKISHVLNAAQGEKNDVYWNYVNTRPAYYTGTGINYKGIPAMDLISFKIAPFFQEAADYIEEALKDKKNKILVHCNCGISRSSTIVVAYLMIKKGKSVKEALRTVREKRNIVPNEGFLQQLCDLDYNLHEGAALDAKIDEEIAKIREHEKEELAKAPKKKAKTKDVVSNGVVSGKLEIPVDDGTPTPRYSQALTATQRWGGSQTALASSSESHVTSGTLRFKVPDFRTSLSTFGQLGSRVRSYLSNSVSNLATTGSTYQLSRAGSREPSLSRDSRYDSYSTLNRMSSLKPDPPRHEYTMKLQPVVTHSRSGFLGAYDKAKSSLSSWGSGFFKPRASEVTPHTSVYSRYPGGLYRPSVDTSRDRYPDSYYNHYSIKYSPTGDYRSNNYSDYSSPSLSRHYPRSFPSSDVRLRRSWSVPRLFA